MKPFDISHSSLPRNYKYFGEDYQHPTKEDVPKIKKCNINDGLLLNDTTNSFIADWQLIEVKLSNEIVIKTEINYNEYR